MVFTVVKIGGWCKSELVPLLHSSTYRSPVGVSLAVQAVWLKNVHV